VDTLRGLGLLLLALIVVAGGYLGYRFWEQRALQNEAAQVIEDVSQLIQRVKGGEAAGSSKSDFDAAFQSFEEARTSYRQGAYRRALAGAQRSKNVLLSLLDVRGETDSTAQAQFITIQGEVEVRRLEGGDWEEAKSRSTLHAGDSVRTTQSGSAEIMFGDRSLYTVRPNTQFIVSASSGGSGGGAADRTIEMDYGWVDLSTSRANSNVKTPGAEARVHHDSEAFVTFDKGSKKGRFGALRGGMEVESKGGLKRSVDTLHQVVQTGDLLSEPEALPDRPRPLEPADNLEIDPGRQKLQLTWQPVPGVSRYALQVSRNHLFVDNVIDSENRAKTHATLGIRGEGAFQWRVAAYAKDGSQGPWSAPRRFRIASARTGGGEKSNDPPPLDLEDVKSYGSIFIVRGKSDPGVRIEINGEPVTVSADGSFQKTVQFTKEGWGFIEIKARDGWGTETVRRDRVFVENP